MKVGKDHLGDVDVLRLGIKMDLRETICEHLNGI
jgi:hypothetical protein